MMVDTPWVTSGNHQRADQVAPTGWNTQRQLQRKKMKVKDAKMSEVSVEPMQPKPAPPRQQVHVHPKTTA
jgi:hypothetical protein